MLFFATNSKVTPKACVYHAMFSSKLQCKKKVVSAETLASSGF